MVKSHFSDDRQAAAAEESSLQQSATQLMAAQVTELEAR